VAGVAAAWGGGWGGVASGSGVSTTVSVDVWRAAACSAVWRPDERLLVGGMGLPAFSVRWWM